MTTPTQQIRTDFMQQVEEHWLAADDATRAAVIERTAARVAAVELRCRIFPLGEPCNIQRETVLVASEEAAREMYADCGYELIDAVAAA